MWCRFSAVIFTSQKVVWSSIFEYVKHLSIDTLKMVELLRKVLNENGVIDKDNLRLNARKYYQYNNAGSLPTLIYRCQPEHLKSPEGDMSNRGKMLYIFENTTPYDFLRSKYHGTEPTEPERIDESSSSFVERLFTN